MTAQEMGRSPEESGRTTSPTYQEARAAAVCQACARGDHYGHRERPACGLLVQFWEAPATWTDCTCEVTP